nr:hypothetical protein [Tanacetum cinerariifolium]
PDFTRFRNLLEPVQNLEWTEMQLELEDSITREQQEWFLVLLTVDPQDIHYAMVQIEYPNHVHLVFEM